MLPDGDMVVPEAVQVCLEGVFRVGRWIFAFETYVGAFGDGDAGWAFDDVGPACRVGDLLAFLLGWRFLAAGHGVLLDLEGFSFSMVLENGWYGFLR